jgi:voltage-gated potassium channel
MLSIQDPVTRRVVSAATMVLIVYCVAIPFFMAVEGLTLVDAIYFTTVSMTSAGYGDIVPHTMIGKLFTSVLLLSAVSIFFYHITHFGQFKEQTIDPHVHRRLQMLRNITALKGGELKGAQAQKIREKMRMRAGGS